MRALTMSEMNFVAGAGDNCTSGGGDAVGPIENPSTFGDAAVAIYEGLVQVTSHIIERVADALG